MSGMDAGWGWVVAAPLVVVVVVVVCGGVGVSEGSVRLRYLPRAPWK